jgi:uncharacterized protein (DUF58 family)
MIVPRTKLLFWVAVVVPPFALLAAVVPTAGLLALALIGGLLLVVVGDALAGGRRLRGLGLELPAVVRMSKDREAKLEWHIRNPDQQKRALRLALAWPPEIRPTDEVIEITLPAGSEWSRLTQACRPTQRGRYRLTVAGMETDSPLGFWGVRQQVPVQSEIRVYPNLLTERKNLAAMFLNRGAFGMHAQRQVGKGRDFEKLREYVPGDGYDEIHWKATARRGRPVTKVFQIEKTQEVYVIVDASRLSARPAQLPPPGAPETEVSASPVLERFVTSALILGLAAEQQGDLFGLLTFSDRVEKFVRAKNGQAHYNACRDALYTLQPKTVTPDFDELCTFIRLRLRRRALLIFLTSLDDPTLAENFVRNVELIRRQHLVLVNMIRPPGVNPLFTNPAIASVDDLYQQLGGHLQWHGLRELQKVLQRRAVQFSLLDHEHLSTGLVSQYMGIKQRQLL